jgi:two-component system cell cycle response regulator
MREKPVGTRVLLVDDEPSTLDLLERHLSINGYEPVRAQSAADALACMFNEAPKIVITDLNMPGLDGLDLCRTLREHEGIGFAYILVLTGECGPQELVRAYEAGADAFMAKPVDRLELLARLRAAERMVRLDENLARRQREIHRLNAEMAIANEKLAEANERLGRMAVTDELTNVYNRREAMTRLAHLTAAGDRYGQVFSCIILDIDYFKRLNDRHGHGAGDTVLRQTAQIMKRCVRETDIVCRVGGEEFLVICPSTPLQGARACAEHIRADIAAHGFTVSDVTLRATVSLGVAEREPNEIADDVLRRADQALYASKQAGRNRTTAAPPSAAPTFIAPPAPAAPSAAHAPSTNRSALASASSESSG